MPLPLLPTNALRALKISLFLAASVGLAHAQSYDVVVYGGSSAGVTAAVQAARMGKHTLLIAQTAHVGGMTASGLGSTDVGNAATIGGLAQAFYLEVSRYYHPLEGEPRPDEDTLARDPDLFSPQRDNLKPQFTFEPHVAEMVMRAMLRRAGATLWRNESLDRDAGVTKNGPWISAIRLRSGRVVTGRVFIDATYEGDLLAAARVPYRIGREGRGEYGETVAGIYPDPELTGEVDPYRVPGAPSSGLLPGVSPFSPGAPGDGDQRIQQYNLRVCLTNDPSKRIEITQPAAYDPADYELLRRRFAADPRRGFGDALKIGNVGPGKGDLNANGSFSTDLAGDEATLWAESSDERRAEIMQRYRDYTAGLLWFLAHEPSLPERVRAEAAQWGLAADEFTDTGHWPWQLYVREARRMIGAYVMTQHDCDGERTIRDPVALASYPSDSHKVTLYVDADGKLATEGYFFHTVNPWPISYRALVPPYGICNNLVVPICVSASHVAFNSMRMEPVFLMLGQSAGTAAAIAFDADVPVQSVDRFRLTRQLEDDGQILFWGQSSSRTGKFAEAVREDSIAPAARRRPRFVPPSGLPLR